MFEELIEGNEETVNASKEFSSCPGLSLAFSYDERRLFMRVDFLDQMHYGNYKFTVDLDSGSETGCHQLTIWAAKKIDIDHVLLSKFTLEQLFRALNEPHKSRLQAQLEDEKAACRQPFDEEIEQLRIPSGMHKERSNVSQVMSSGKYVHGKIKSKRQKNGLQRILPCEKWSPWIGNASTRRCSRKRFAPSKKTTSYELFISTKHKRNVVKKQDNIPQELYLPQISRFGRASQNALDWRSAAGAK